MNTLSRRRWMSGMALAAAARTRGPGRTIRTRGRRRPRPRLVPRPPKVSSGAGTDQRGPLVSQLHGRGTGPAGKPSRGDPLQPDSDDLLRPRPQLHPRRHRRRRLTRFVGTGIVPAFSDVSLPGPDRTMTALARGGIYAFRIRGRSTRPDLGNKERWMDHPGFDQMFAAGARHDLCLSFLMNSGGPARVGPHVPALSPKLL